MVQGDEAAYRAFYDAYYDRLRRYLLVVTAGDEDATREALQSALLRLVRHIKVFPDETTFWGWLTVLARTAFIDQTRRRKRYWSFLERFTRHTAIQSSSPAETTTSPHLLQLLDDHLSTLPQDERDLLEAKYLDGRSVRQIADTLQTSEKAIESRLVRIRRKLKSQLLTRLKDEPSP